MEHILLLTETEYRFLKQMFEDIVNKALDGPQGREMLAIIKIAQTISPEILEDPFLKSKIEEVTCVRSLNEKLKNL